MSIYAIGDVQGCFTQLQALLKKINFDPAHDVLWFTGDLVNRGPQSLETLRFVSSLDRHCTVLGNHDLHLLALMHGIEKHPPDDSLRPILNAPDCTKLTDWLCQQPLLHHDEASGFVMTHAGLAPSWDIDLAKNLAREVETILRGDNTKRTEFFRHMYGNQPDMWRSYLAGWDRLRCITNHFTRMRFCYADGRLELDTTENMEINTDSGLLPWFCVPGRVNANQKIIFGHWAALGGVTHTENVFALDTGCVWGYCLTAMRLEDGERFSVNCHAE